MRWSEEFSSDDYHAADYKSSLTKEDLIEMNTSISVTMIHELFDDLVNDEQIYIHNRRLIDIAHNKIYCTEMEVITDRLEENAGKAIVYELPSDEEDPETYIIDRIEEIQAEVADEAIGDCADIFVYDEVIGKKISDMFTRTLGLIFMERAVDDFEMTPIQMIILKDNFNRDLDNILILTPDVEKRIHEIEDACIAKYIEGVKAI